MTTPGRRVTVACVDDDTLIREGISSLLPDLSVVATFDSVEALLTAAPVADVVLLDLWLAREPPWCSNAMQGVNAVAATSKAGYRVLIYTNERRPEVLAGCLAAGAQGAMQKTESLPALVDAVQAVARGEVVVTTALAGLAEVVQRRGGMPALSPRQLDVLRGRARGETFKSIASRLFISPKTAEEYMAQVTRRFATYLADHSPADLERLLGVGPGDLLDRSRAQPQGGAARRSDT